MIFEKHKIKCMLLCVELQKHCTYVALHLLKPIKKYVMKRGTTNFGKSSYLVGMYCKQLICKKKRSMSKLFTMNGYLFIYVWYVEIIDVASSIV